MIRADNVFGIPVFSAILRPLLTSARMFRPTHAAATKTERSHVSISGILADTARQRWLEPSGQGGREIDRYEVTALKRSAGVKEP
jgi:hypothetical protein